MLALPGFRLQPDHDPVLADALDLLSVHLPRHPYVFCAAVLMLGLISQGRRARCGGAPCSAPWRSAFASHSYVFGAVLQHETFVGGFSKIEFQMNEEEKVPLRDLRRLVAMIPESASVAASENEVPHIAARYERYTLKDGDADAEYVLVHSTTWGWARARGADLHGESRAVSPDR
jgi:hypothetical protein